MTDKTPALPEPEDDIVAQLRGCAAFRRDRGEVKSPGLMDQAAARLQEALDRADRAEKERDELQHQAGIRQSLTSKLADRATTDEAALEGARKVIEGVRDYFIRDGWNENSIMIEGLDKWLSANPEAKG